MKTIATIRLNLAVLTAGLLACASVNLNANDHQPDGRPRRVEVTGTFDWSIVPPNLGAYIIPGTDGDLYLRNAPLVGTFALTGKGITLDPDSTRISVQLKFIFEEIGPGNSDTYTLTGCLSPAPR